MRETLRVLVVEDNRGDIDLIREALSDTRFVNFQIDSVSRLSEALARLKNTGIDLILLDLGLPDSNGLETFRRLLEAKPRIPVIILTGNDNEEMAVAAVREGAQDYLIKGLPWGRLLAHSAQHAIERKQRESREQLVREVLDLLNRPAAAMETIHDILQLIKKGTGFEAVGIRLKEGNDFPYYATNGFPEDFVQAESRLCAYDEAGKIVCDEQGNPVLECMCGNIIYRRTDASLPFFTASGSFWTNSTSELLASTTEEDRQSRTRNRCHGEGYESVALIPLQTGDEIIGLLQLNDHRRKRFTLEMIHFFEGLGASIGIALTRKRAEVEIRALLESVQREKIRLSSLVNSITDEVWFADAQKRFTLANPSALRQFCIDPDQTIEVESLAKSLIVLRPDGSVRPVEEAPPLRALLGEVVINQEEIVQVPASGEYRHRQVNAAPVRDFSGNIIGSVSVVRDITEKKRGEKQLQDTLESLRKAVSTTIQVMVSTVEARDPYTAGHQTRSADLARAIATELGLPQDKIDGIRMAGSIHDIGKISIPAEILSKPTKLTEIEFSLIKEHAYKGFEMLKDVESPWPLAETVYQHHELMDGSGYPRSLKGEEICIEARILTVADVVEAMASHRPYRPGLGINAALDEIENNRGTIYDKTVADACLRLFREKSFKLAKA
jgi:PAS domain S-box-containing protein